MSVKTFYDEKAAERVVHFINTLLETRGQPTLMPQEQGWVHEAFGHFEMEST